MLAYYFGEQNGLPILIATVELFMSSLGIVDFDFRGAIFLMNDYDVDDATPMSFYKIAIAMKKTGLPESLEGYNTEDHGSMSLIVVKRHELTTVKEDEYEQELKQELK